MPRVLKHIAAIVLLVLFAGCAGGGACTSCGMTPLPSGFKPEARIENAGSVRVTDTGLNFIEANLGTLAQSLIGAGNGGVVTFEVPESQPSIPLVDATICPGGADPNASPPKCVAEIDIGNAALQMQPINPHDLLLLGPLPLRIQNLPIEVDYGIFGTDTTTVVLNGNGACPPNNQTFAPVTIQVDVSIEIDSDPAHSGFGYSRVRFPTFDVNTDQISDAINFCGGGFTSTVLDLLKGVVIDLAADQLIGTVKDQLEQALCRQANPALDPTCPQGTFDVDGVCRYANDPAAECASTLLGIDGHMNLGQLLASISPGTTGGLDLLFAAGGASPSDLVPGISWGDMHPIDSGMTLGMYGGAEPTPISKCVPFSEMALPAGIPIPDELAANTVADWPAGIEGPHVGIAVSERFANYALNGMFNSGLFCLGITTEAVPLLNSGTLGLLVNSMQDLALQREQQQLAIVIRPSVPPTVTFGNGTSLETDPLIRVRMNQASFDFYVWSLDRFIRFMTATFDLDVPLNLVVTPEGLVPVLEKIGVENGVVTNNELLREDPQTIADALAGLIASQVGQAVGGGIAPINLNDTLASLGLGLIIPDSVEGQGSPGLRRLTKDTDNYLGIFATLALATQAAQLTSETTAGVKDKHVDAEGLRLPTMTPDNAPRMRLVMGSPLDDGTRTIEYSYRVDQGVWHPFTRARIVDVQDDWLRLQGRHVISVRSRVAGEPLSLDPTPATVEVVVDTDAPAVQVGAVEDGRVALDVRDLVSDAEHAKVRYRLDGGAWSAWSPASAARLVDVGEAEDIEIEAIDEEGNVATAQQALIRGRADPTSAGCACALAGGAAPTRGLGWLLGATLAAIAMRARRRRAKASLVQQARCGALGLAVIAAAGVNSGCSCGDDPTLAAKCADCVSLDPGLAGAYTSVAVEGSNIWVAGYAEADWNNGFQWGDLVVGAWTGEAVRWVAVDGVPTEPAVDSKAFDVTGFRGGQTDPGVDVGLWTSIAIGPDGEPAVAYFDRTNRALKFAKKERGELWAVSTVQQAASSDIGRYAKLLFVNGAPVIAYLAIEPGDGGAVRSHVRLATGLGASPGEGEWTFENVATDEATPCREHLCASGTRCIVATGLCTQPLPEADCGECATGTECVTLDGAATCADIYDSTRLDTYPDAIGDYIAMAQDPSGGVALAFYDRIHGNLVIASKSGGTWATLVVDGQAADGTDTGDVGMGASLFVDSAGDWHLSYADGLAEGLRYTRVVGGTQVMPFEVADDGLGIEGVAFDDGQHIVGDDSRIFVSDSGEVFISYQDATDGTLRLATGTQSGDAHTWLVRVIDQEGFAGAFSQILEIDGSMRIANWWRVGGQTVRGDVAIVSP